MTSSERRTRGQRAGLTREVVLAEARALVAAEGAAQLSMRRLAGRLGVAPNALYTHVTSHDALVDAVLDDLLGEVSTARLPADWQAAIAAIMRRTFAVLVQHPDLVGLYLARRGARGPQAVALGELMTTILARGGVTGETADEAVRTLVTHAIGFAAFTVGDPLPDASEVLSQRAVERRFARSLGWLLTGLAEREAR